MRSTATSRRLFGVSIEVARGEAVAVIGANGAGKSALLKSIAGLLRARPDAIVFDGAPIGGLPAYAVAARGIALVPEGRGLFPSLSVEENLLIGGQLKRPGPWTLARVYELFPVLAERRETAVDRAVGRPAADGRARPRADVESETCCCATKSAWGSRRSWCATSMRGCRRS